MEVLVDPREVGVDSVVWRGGAVLSGLETAQAHQIRLAFFQNVVFDFAKFFESPAYMLKFRYFEILFRHILFV